jgi:hypothetical protein
MQTGPELFDRAAAARARLLRVARFGGGGSPVGLVLTFDAGHITIVPDSDTGLAITHAEQDEPIPENIDVLDEEDPWWRLLGTPLTEASSEREGPVVQHVLLRFREANDNPRRVRLLSRGGAVAALLEPTT